jgi:ribonuclease D
MMYLLQDEERFPSRRRLADGTRIDLGLLSTAIRLAELPLEVVKVFSSPAQLQHRHAKPLTDAIRSNLDAVLNEVQLIKAHDVSPTTNEIIKRLTNFGRHRKVKKNEIVLLVENTKVGSIHIEKNGHPKMALDMILDVSGRSQLKAVLEAFCIQIQSQSKSESVGAVAVLEIEEGHS